jgi:toxin ParE1/3/4
MTCRVIFRPAAERDLLEIADWVAERASIAVAIGYVERLQRYCGRLDMFPKRGTPRDDLYPGLRTIGFERRALIGYLVLEDTVPILRILYGGQDFEAVFSSRMD